MNIAKLVNEINDFDVGIPRAEMRAAEERGECKRLLQQVHSGNVVRLPNLEGRLTLARGEVTVVHRYLDHVAISTSLSGSTMRRSKLSGSWSRG